MNKRLKRICAIATDDSVHLMERHFGDAVKYDLYNLDDSEIFFKDTIVNPFREDDEDDDAHMDKIKAGNMKELFLEQNVSILVSKRFGPNIKRMVKNFVPVIIQHDEIERAKELLVISFEAIECMVHRGQERKPVILR